MVTEGRKRGLSYNKIAELVARNPAERFGLRDKGDLRVGLGRRLRLVDDDVEYVVRAEDSLSTQEYTPFEGFT